MKLVFAAALLVFGLIASQTTAGDVPPAARQAPLILDACVDNLVGALDASFKDTVGIISAKAEHVAYAVLSNGSWEVGDTITVRRLGETVRDGEALVRLSQAIGTFQVAKARGSVVQLHGDVASLAVGDVGVKRQPLLKAVVLPASQVNCAAPEIAATLADLLASALNNAGTFRILNRDNINELITEIQFGSSGLVDSSSAQAIGKMYGADIVIFPSIVGSFTGPLLICKVVSTETAVVVGGVVQSLYAGPVDVGMSESANFVDD